jgi:nucleotide-binding universal stress UspA family protein
MKTILIAYDGSPCADAILTELRHVGLPLQLNVHVIAVEELFLTPVADPGQWSAMPSMVPVLPSVADVNAQLATKAEATAAHGATQLRAAFPSWTVTSGGAVDSVTRAILLKATDVLADAIFVGSHSRSAVGRFFLGSVSHKIAAEANCTVHICRPHPPFAKAPRVVVAVDGSAAANAAVQEIITREWPSDTIVAAVSVIKSPFGFGADFAGDYSDEWLRLRLHEPREVQDGRVIWLEKIAQTARHELAAVGIHAEAHTLIGTPKDTLLAWAEEWKADCIFVGASGTQHPAADVFGTVASAISVRAHCSVEIVRVHPVEVIANGPAL